MTRADLLRARAHDCETRARSYADRATMSAQAEEFSGKTYVDLTRASDVEAITARVLLELADVEEEAA